MICVEVHSNNVLTARNDTFANAVSDSQKHETVKFLFCDNWKDYQKTAVFSAEGVDPINILLDSENELCIGEDECYIPFEVLKGEEFAVSVFGVKGDSLATTTKASIEILESGYALGDKPQDPTPDEYSQIVTLITATKEIAQSVRDDADNGVFNGEKGEKGDKGDKGEKGADGVGKITDAGGEVFNSCDSDAAAKNAHAEGSHTRADGNSAHAEGQMTNALGIASHAGGNTTNAYGDYSHASGDNTRADYVGQMAVGRFNARPTEDSVFTVGNGSSNTDRKNAFNVYADGHAEVMTMGTSPTENTVATKQYVDEEIATFDFIKVVDKLPLEGLSNKIYLVPSVAVQEQNLFDEYIWLGDKWEFITSKVVEVDLTPYYQKSQVDGLVANLQSQINNSPLAAHPVGSIYITASSTANPSTLFGGTWEKQIVKKTIYGIANVENFQANVNHPTTVTGLIDNKMLYTNYAINVTPYSSAANTISCSAINVTGSGGYISSFNIYTNRSNTTVFSVFWSITGESEFDQDGCYHWKRTA